MKRIDMYIGLGNQNIYEDKLKGDLKKQIANFFETEKIAYSLADIMGGYVYNNNKYIFEKSLRVTVIGDYSKDEIKEFADAIKTNYVQESVLVDINNMDVKYE